jgi:outer membrane lipopolysaccharide assembly protein LptE/RlpB
LSDRQLVSSASSGATVKRISRSLDFNVKSAEGEMIAPARTLRQQKDVALDDDNLLASNRERENTILELEQSLYQQLIRQLTRI